MSQYSVVTLKNIKYLGLSPSKKKRDYYILNIMLKLIYEILDKG